MTQLTQIKAHLERGQRITPLGALDLYGCFRLGARIYDLKKSGYPIEKRMIQIGEKHYAEYRKGTKA